MGLRVCRDIQPGTELLLLEDQQEASFEEVLQVKACENRDQDEALEAITLDHRSGCSCKFTPDICTV